MPDGGNENAKKKKSISLISQKKKQPQKQHCKSSKLFCTFLCRCCCNMTFPTRYTAISRKVVGKNVHATFPKGNMGYD